MARSARNRHLPAHSRSGHRLRSCDRSRRALSPASSVPFDVRPERQPASNVLDRSSSSQGGKGAALPSPAPRRAPASVTPASGNWPSCPMPKHIAQRHRPSACLSSASTYRRSPTPHRCRRRAYQPGSEVPSPAEPPSRRQQQQNGAADHSHPAQDALPLAERSCDHPVRSAPPRKVDTFAAVTCDPSALGTARASAQARLPNPTLFPPWPALQMPTTHKSLKN